jgi:cell division cycle 2-like protein
MDKMVREAAEFKMRQVDDERADADANAPGVGPPASRPTASVNVAAIMAMRTPSSDGDATPRDETRAEEIPSLDGFRDSDENANVSRGGLDDLALLEDGDDDAAGDDVALRRPSRSPSPERAAIPSDSDASSEDLPRLGRGGDDDSPSSPPGAPSAPRAFDATAACRSVFEFEQVNKIDEGTYGVVFRARDKRSGKIYALKKVKMEKEREGFPQTALREANILLSMRHPNVVDVSEMVVGNSLDSVFMVMEFCEHDLKCFMSTMRAPFSVPEVKCLMKQLLSGVAYMHENWTLHRDLKTSNILVNNRGELKICDFGLARVYGEPLGAYTPTVVTLWYRAPELLLGVRRYGPAIDVWSLGCIMAELLASEPLFTGKTEIDQLSKMFATLGAPSDAVWPGCKELPGARKVTFPNQPYNHLRRRFPGPPSDESQTFVAIGPDGRERRADDTRHTPAPLSDAGFDLLNRMLAYDPAKRITAEDASKHPFFAEFPPAKAQRLMPTFPSRAGNVSRRVRESAGARPGSDKSDAAREAGR